MRITINQLRRIIREELTREAGDDVYASLAASKFDDSKQKSPADMGRMKEMVRKQIQGLMGSASPEEKEAYSALNAFMIKGKAAKPPSEEVKQTVVTLAATNKNFKEILGYIMEYYPEAGTTFGIRANIKPSRNPF